MRERKTMTVKFSRNGAVAIFYDPPEPDPPHVVIEWPLGWRRGRHEQPNEVIEDWRGRIAEINDA